MKKKLMGALLMAVVIVSLTACDYTTTPAAGSSADFSNTASVANDLAANQPTPTDIDYSLERFNLIRRAYWVNGQREKALAYPCPIADRPLGYVVLFTESGATVGCFEVDGKVSSLNSYLAPDSEYYEFSKYSSTTRNHWLADVDGSYGENDNGIFFFTPDGKYIEWTGTYLYSDIPFIVDTPTLRWEAAANE